MPAGDSGWDNSQIHEPFSLFYWSQRFLTDRHEMPLCCLTDSEKICCLVIDSPKGAGGESSSLDEDSSDALSPDQLTNHDSPLSAVPQLSPPDVLTQNGDTSPPQVPLQDVMSSLGRLSP